MDGLDISTLSQLDEDVFRSSSDSEAEEFTLPMPDCVGLDSAVQDDYKSTSSNMKKSEACSDLERNNPSSSKTVSIRQEILRRSMDGIVDAPSSTSAAARQSHVMNIVEKAGMKGIDKNKINKIIHEASEGSLFYKRQAQRQEDIHRSIEKMLIKVKAATPEQVASAQITCDNMLEELKAQRTFNKVIVHFDLDMFFAAVEIRDNPSLADKPLAVGGESMVSTSNYIARKFGVRAAMPGFIAKKLCPQLILIKPNGAKYREVSAKVFEILEEYDSDLTPMSLDEAYLDLTEHIKGLLESEEFDLNEYYDGTLPNIWWQKADEVVKEIRDKIFQITSLTCSAGIACNTLVSKIATDINKPNGQFMVRGYPKDIDTFIKKTPVEKVSGIGKVSAQFLNALEIQNCGDIQEKRHFLPLVFYTINIKFYLRVSLGDGCTKLQADDQRKSKSIEQTFSAIKDPIILIEKLNIMCEQLCSRYLKPYRIRGRTVTVKLKRSDFTTLTRSCSLLLSTNDRDVIFKAAKNILNAELCAAGPNISYRLLGVRLSSLADDGVVDNQLTIDVLFQNQELASTASEQQNFVDEKIIDNNEIYSNMSISSLETQEQPRKKLKPNTPPTQRTGTQKNNLTSRDSSSKTKTLIKKDISSPNKPYYESFMEYNSQVFSQTQKLEPFSCPFCYHLFMNFNLLESHAKICTKNKTKVDTS